MTSPMTSQDAGPEVVEQLYYTWDRRNIEGTGGLGIFAQSTGWPALGAEEARDLKRRLQLYGDQVEGHDLVVGGHALAWYRIGERYYLVRKSDAGKDAVGRPGNFVAHVLTGFQRSIGHWAVRGLWNADVPARGLAADAEPGRNLPPIHLDLRGVRTAPAAGLTATSVDDCVAAILREPTGTVVISGSDPAEVEAAVLQVVAAFGPGTADDLTFSTHEIDPVAAAVTVAGLVGDGPRFAQLRERAARGASLLVDLHDNRFHGPEPTARELGLATALRNAGPAELAPGRLRTLAERLTPLLLLDVPLGKLTGPDIVLILTSACAGRWWVTKVPADARLDVVRSALRCDASATLAALGALGAVRRDGTDDEAALRSAVLQEIADRADEKTIEQAGRTIGLGDAEHAHLHLRAWLGGRSEADPRRIAPAVVRCRSIARTVELEEALADDTLGAIVPQTAAFQGGDAVDLLDVALSSRDPMSPFLTEAVRRRPHEVNLAIDRYLTGHGAEVVAGVAPLAERLTGSGGLAPEALPQLLGNLLTSRVVALPQLLGELLAHHHADPAAVRDVLIAHRDDLAAIYHLPPALIDALCREDDSRSRRWWPASRSGRS